MESRSSRWWAASLIIFGVALLLVVFAAALAIARDPGGYYDEWVPADGPVGPEAAFEWSSSGFVVSFVDMSKVGDAGIERWVWDFGDGAESSEPSPSHRFAEESEYSVTLDVVDANGSSSRAESTVGVERGGSANGEGAIGLSDLADRVTAAVEDSAKGGAVVLLVIGMFVVLTMIGGRLLRQGVRALRPIPDRITVKLRPKELELAAADSALAQPQASIGPGVADPNRETTVHEHQQPVGVGS